MLLHAWKLGLGAFASLWLTASLAAGEKATLKMLIELTPEDYSTLPPESVIETCTRVLNDKKPRSTDSICQALLHRGDAYLCLQKPVEANADYEALCKLSPKNARARSARALALGLLGRFDEAIDEASEGVRLGPKQPGQHVALANLLAAQGKWRDAATSVQNALELDPKCSSAHHMRGWIAYAEGDNRACVASLTKYLELSPLPALAEPDAPYWLRGMALMNLVRPREALANFLMARKLSPMSGTVADAIAMAYSEMGRFETARKACEDTCRLRPDDARCYLLCAQLQSRTGAARAAEKSLEKAIALLPVQVEPPQFAAFVSASKGWVHFYSERYKQASELFDEALQMDVACETARWGKCTLMATCPDPKYQDGERALRLAKKVLDDEKQRQRDEGHQFAAYRLLADAEAACGNYASAIGAVRKALELAGPDRDTKDLRDREALFEGKQPYRYKVPNEEGPKNGSPPAP
jgi:tetratricopeptide (TPR) repeat protein